jgi:hypothetical protein
MFFGATAFNQLIDAWNVNNVTDVTEMFRNATSYNRDLDNLYFFKIETLPTNFSTGATAWGPVGTVGVPNTNRPFYRRRVLTFPPFPVGAPPTISYVKTRITS